jgi:hypothetical protein
MNTLEWRGEIKRFIRVWQYAHSEASRISVYSLYLKLRGKVT